MKLVVAVLVISASLSGVVSAREIVNGRMIFPAKNGDVLFNHDGHVDEVMGNCKPCHKSPGGIEGFGKSYAHEVCIGCHQPQGNFEGGPITCDGCHGAH